MSASELRRRLQAVDPNLNIIPGGIRRHGKTRASNWDKAAGPVCSTCGKEYFRGRDGLCYSCWEIKKDNEIEVRDTTGITQFLPMDIIEQITHPARKNQ